MSNILPTVGRSVQYVTPAGAVQAAVITSVEPLTITVFKPYGGIATVLGAKIENTNDRSVQSNVIRLTWQGR
jgi:hypothetical protein